METHLKTNQRRSTTLDPHRGHSQKTGVPPGTVPPVQNGRTGPLMVQRSDDNGHLQINIDIKKLYASASCSLIITNYAQDKPPTHLRLKTPQTQLKTKNYT